MLGNLENLKFPQFIDTIKNKITPYWSSTLYFKYIVNIFSRAFPVFYNFLHDPLSYLNFSNATS